MTEALKAAIALHDFIRSNTGENADWPIQITSSEAGALEKLDTLLKNFKEAVTHEKQAH
jgi:hypothetical protein